MLSVQEAQNIILQHKITLDVFARNEATERVLLMDSLGRILAEDLVADRDFPPFDRVTMDGIAIRFEDFKRGIKNFRVTDIQAAGSPQMSWQGEGTCLEVMTGAILPEGCDTIIRYEDLKIENGIATVLIENIDFQQNIHKKGIDRKQNDVLLLSARTPSSKGLLTEERGVKITAAEIATAATIGKSVLKVVKLPKIAIISTGDELVDVHETPLLHQIRRSNVYSLAALLETEFKISGDLFHFNDDETAITEGLSAILKEYEIVILSGAVSEGKFDFVPKALDNLGVKKLFHKVAQRPGKPFWFGVFNEKTVIFALPGNPVSTFLCACKYVLPFIKLRLGFKHEIEYAVLAETVNFKPDLTYFIPVKLQNTVQEDSFGEGGVLKAQPLAGHGSGDLANLNDSDGFLELPRGQEVFEMGTAYPLIRYRK
jgi:molybdopterin molybdotransferase